MDTNTNNLLVRIDESGAARIPTNDVNGNPITLTTKNGIPLVPMILQLQNTIDSLPYDHNNLYSESMYQTLQGQ